LKLAKAAQYREQGLIGQFEETGLYVPVFFKKNV